jgi:glycosyltransferase involved in cell wall biosynthesis
MRIAVVHSFYSSAQPSGENAVVLDQVAALRSAGHDVHLLARETDEVGGGPLYPMASALTAATGFGPSPGAQLDGLQPDIVHLHNTFPNWGSGWTRRWLSRLVTTVHNFRPICASATLFRDGHDCSDCLSRSVIPAIRHRCYRDSAAATAPVALGTRPGGPLRGILTRSAQVVVLNPYAQTLYERVLGREVRLVPNFVPASRPGSIARPRGWVFVGRLTEEKGIRLLLADWPTGERLDVIGTGPLAGEVGHLVSDREDIQVLGPMSREDVLSGLSSYEGLVVPSLWREGLPTTILEAMAAGRPSLVSSRIASAEMLRAQGAAVVYTPGDPTSLAASLAYSRKHRESLGVSCLNAHQARYSQAAWLEAIEQVYTTVAGANC